MTELNTEPELWGPNSNPDVARLYTTIKNEIRDTWREIEIDVFF